jgi:superfamily II DNA or RNA helicase
MKKKALDFLNKNGSILLALHVGFGKSILSLYLACQIRLKTLILVHRVILIDQWVDSIKTYCQDANIGKFPFKDEDDTNFDFVVMNIVNIPKLSFDILKTFGLIIVDECHLISTEHFSKSLQYLTPRYLIGLSATPYRKDGMDKILDIYFGPDKLIEHLKIEHVVYKIQTSYQPPILVQRNGQIDWNHIIDSQSKHEKRNDMIVQIASFFKDRYILILCKRKEQVNVLCQKLLSLNESVTRLIGNDKQFDKNARILIATINKAGVGFSHDILDTLILASDVEEYYIQYLGRITRRPDVKPIIFDIIDHNKTLKNHFRTRKTVYETIGGVIKNFQSEFPNIHVI